MAALRLTVHRAIGFCLPLLLAGGLCAQVRSPSQYPPPNPIPIQRDPRIPPPGTADGPGARKGTKAVHASGVVDKVTARYFTVATPQKKTLSFQYSERTHFLRDGKSIAAADLKPGDRVQVDAEEDARGWLNASEVTVELEAGETAQPAAPEKAPAAPKPDANSAPPAATEKSGEVKPESQTPPQTPDVIRIAAGAVSAPPPDADDSGPPVLRRGTPVKQPAPAAQKRATPTSKPVETAKAAPPSPATQPEAQPRAAAAPPRDPRMAFIERARDAAGAFAQKLPNFICQQVTTRYTSQSSGRSWQVSDLLTANVVVEDGQESYRNIAIDGKPANKSMEELGGSWSTGEFATVLEALFATQTETHFTYKKDEVQSHLSAAVYEFQVDKPHSNWQITSEGAKTIPAFHGTIWIDKDSARVLRIEQQAVGLPADYPLDTVESTVEYEFVLLGGQKFLLPARAENLGCTRGTSFCAHNTIEFRNYRRFSSESTIIFDK